MQPWVSICLSGMALFISAVTLWLTYFRRGTIKMTQPAVIFFGPDQGGPPKVYLRTLLYSTSKRGQRIEYIYVVLRRGETSQAFNVWVYGEKELVRGSGLHVGESGHTANHHFLLPRDDTGFEFRAGEYALDVIARRIGDQANHILAHAKLAITQAEAEHIKSGKGGVYFGWGPESKRYHSHLDSKSEVKKYSDSDLAALMGAMTEALKPKSS